MYPGKDAAAYCDGLNDFPRTALKRGEAPSIGRYVMRWIAIFLVLSLGACGSIGATAFRDQRTGKTVAACGPMQGFSAVLRQARQICVKSYLSKGWVQAAL